MMNIKVGDKVYCKKSAIITGSNKLPDYAHIIGKIYSVFHLGYDTDLDELRRIDTVFLESEPTTPNGVWGYDYYYFKRDFITLKELRKQKLEKINESR